MLEAARFVIKSTPMPLEGQCMSSVVPQFLKDPHSKARSIILHVLTADVRQATSLSAHTLRIVVHMSQWDIEFVVRNAARSFVQALNTRAPQTIKSLFDIHPHIRVALYENVHLAGDCSSDEEEMLHGSALSVLAVREKLAALPDIRDVSPFQLHFTHDSISSRFRSGLHVDDAIDRIAEGRLESSAFPFLVVTEYGGSMFCLSNRRLFMFRVLARMGVLQTARVQAMPWDSSAVQRTRWERSAWRTKWERAYSTTSDGLRINVKSRYEHLQAAPIHLRIVPRGVQAPENSEDEALSASD
mmetsp:Transcript_150668/g.482107  ORF Transcript_150668/g.482107 Transcript_150668/m.482107 type:complete len:300 (-) Transcript_150668:156-1055(-)